MVTNQCTLAAYVFVPSFFRENIPTAEIGVISAETAGWDIERKFLMRTLLYASPIVR